MKNIILSEEYLKVLGDISKERADESMKALCPNWAFIVYPESAPSNWVSILEEYFIPFAVSPLHDIDVNPTGEPKKPHYHILLTNGQSKKSFSQLYEIAKRVNGTSLINVHSVKGYYRYFCHLDNPEKAQYKQSDIRCYCGFDSDNLLKPSYHTKLNQISINQTYCSDYKN